jgi:glycolate oxidase
MLDSTVHAQLAAILPPAALLVSAEDTKPYECDGLTLYRAQPAAVALPENEAQIVAVLKACHAARIPVVARGAGTSLSGGALPDPEGVVLAQLKRIIAIDRWRAAVSRACAAAPFRPPAYGLCAPDPSSQIACSIGGTSRKTRAASIA